MMRRENHATRKRDAVISERMERRLAAYVTAAGAAGVGLLAFAQPAEAQIDYTPVNVKLQCGPHVQGTYFCQESALLDFDGTTYFQLLDRWNYNLAAGSANYFNLGLVGRQPGAAVAFANSFREAELQPGALIGPNQQWKPGGPEEMADMLSFSSFIPCFSSGGSWQNVKGGFLGLRFKIDGQTHYGWAEVSTDTSVVSPCGLHVWLTGYAYNTAPDDPILAGQKTEDEAGKVQPATLGVLSLGSLGLDLWRTSRASEPESSPK
jgi:hypothetical protein